MSRDVRITAALTFAGVNMDGYIGKGGHSVEKFMPDRFSYTMTLAGGHLTVNRNVQFGTLAVPHPTDCDVIDFHDTLGFRSNTRN
jgi:hypothetical protein